MTNHARFISVVVITRNREKIIDSVINAISAFDYPREKFELIVVDNGSTDNTFQKATDTLSSKHIEYSIVLEEKKGICSARNKGIEVANGEWVLFLDDDVKLDNDLLHVYEQAVSLYPDAAAFGGPATLDPEIPRPWWWIDEFDKTMSCQNYGEEYLYYPIGTNPYGLNMLINRQALLKFNGFNERLDILTSSFADETELFLRLRNRGEKILYVPDAMVVHSVMPDRLQWRNFMNRMSLVGRSHACLDHLHKTRHGRPLLRRMLSAALLFSKKGSPALFAAEYNAWLGYKNFSIKN